MSLLSSLLKDLRATTDLLERIAADWRVLDELPDEERRRFHDAIARMYNPDPLLRRRRMKAEERGAAALDEAERAMLACLLELKRR